MSKRVGAPTDSLDLSDRAAPKPKRKEAAAVPAAPSSSSLAPSGGARKRRTPDPRPPSPEIERGVTPSPQRPGQSFNFASTAANDDSEGEDGFEEVNVFPPGVRRELSSFDPISPPVLPKAKRALEAATKKRARTDESEREGTEDVEAADQQQATATSTAKGKGRATVKQPRAKKAAAADEAASSSSNAAGSSRPRRSAVKPAIVDLRPTELDGVRRAASEDDDDEEEESAAPAAKRRAISKSAPAARKGSKRQAAEPEPESDSDASMADAQPPAAAPASDQEFPPDDRDDQQAVTGEDEQVEDEEEEEDPDALVASAAAPRVRVVNGEVVLDEDSLQIEREVEDTSDRPVIQEDDRSRAMASAAYSKRKSAGRWSKKETDKFFDVRALSLAMQLTTQLLEQFGQNFELISMLLPGRTRAMCIRKLAREDRIDSARVDKAIRARKPIDKDALAAIGITADAPTPPELKPAEKEAEPANEDAQPEASTSAAAREKPASDDDDDDFDGAPFGESAPFAERKSKAVAAPAPEVDSEDEQMEEVP